MAELTDEQALQNFLLDIDCLDALLPWTGKFNLFDVLKITRTEIRHSNVLGWLLNPNENHGLGDAYLKGILQRIVENDTTGRYDVFKLLLLDMYSFSVYREWKNIDILLTSSEEKVLIAIENKVGSHEHSNQLNRYRDILEKEFEGYNKVYIFLTPDGEEPSDVENWDVLTYYDIVDVLENTCEKVELQPDVKLMVRNYIEVIRRDIVEDQQLIDICNKIYNKHKKALDLIYENRVDGRAQISESIKNTLLALADEGKIIYSTDGDWGYNFQTKEMNELLPHLDEPVSSWGSESVYAYWFNLRDNRFYGILELAGNNVPDAQMEVMQKIIDVMKPGDKRRENFTYKRVYKTKWFDLNDIDDVEAETDKAVREAVNDLLSMQKKLLASINE